MRGVVPTRTVERALLAHTADGLVAGMDEVGRGAIAGPVSVGVVVVGPGVGRMPAGLRDSKMLAATARERLVGPVRRWGIASAVGHADAGAVDALGVIGALRLAGRRGLASVAEQGAAPQLVLLDGSHDWLTRPAPGLFEFDDVGDSRGVGLDEQEPTVVTRVKADLTCAVVAAASVLAKCERDALMRALHAERPEFDWARNKGYAAAAHLAALREHGPSPWHRLSWRLPGREPGMMGQ